MGTESGGEPVASGWRLAAACAALVALGLGYAAFQALRAPEVAFLGQRPPARWIVYPLPPAMHIRTGDFVGLTADYRRRFELAAEPGPVRLRLRAFREFRAWVNGREVGSSAPEASWKQEQILEVGPLLAPGTNEILVRVRAAYGPPALWLATEGLPEEISTDPSWTAVLPELPPREARPARDTIPYPPSYSAPRPLPSLRTVAPLLLGVFAASTLGFGLLGRRGAPAGGARRWLVEHPAEVVLGAALVASLVLAVNNASRGRIEVGFDASSHVAYVEHLLEHGELPPTNRVVETLPDGTSVMRWEGHQPPLFYGLSALVLAGAREALPPDAARRWLRAVPQASAMGTVAVTYAAARVLVPAASPAAAVAVAFAALAPMNVYMGHYVSNEPLSALLIGASLALGAWLLVRPRPGPGGFLALGVTSGLALMTKATFAATLPLLLALLGYRLLCRDGRGLGTASARLGLVLAPASLLGGWFYLRSWVLFGTPLVLPWEGQMGIEWWQDPGYHTAAYFLSFGRVFVLPFFAGTYSFLDSLYATFWGDAFLGGMPGFGLPGQPPWNYAFMTSLYLLAVPATALIAAGALRAVGRVVRQDSAGWALVLTATFLAGLSLLLMNLRIPYYAQAKSFYALGALVPLALLAGEGFGWVDDLLRERGGPWLQALLRAYVLTLAFAVAASFFAVPGVLA